ncbi:MAG: acetyltransferase [Candidatus Cloacimonas sp. SDB]|nr:MAG: acetyltransferase [Candidatus Cloacimonas sp. SDB]
MIIKINNCYPKIGKNTWISETSTIIGDVEIGNDCSIWFGAVIRGDIHFIRIGNRTNIQDLCVIHVTAEEKTDSFSSFPVVIGNDVTIGHKAMIHGCTISDACLIGMNAILQDGCKIGSESIVGAGSLVTKNCKFPPRSMIFGSPAKLIRELTDQEIAFIYESSEHYIDYMNMYK